VIGSSFFTMISVVILKHYKEFKSRRLILVPCLLLVFVGAIAVPVYLYCLAVYSWFMMTDLKSEGSATFLHITRILLSLAVDLFFLLVNFYALLLICKNCKVRNEKRSYENVYDGNLIDDDYQN
jgi:hypothetical protein